MKHSLAAAALLSALLLAPAQAEDRMAVLPMVPDESPSIVVTISVPRQELRVVVDGVEMYVWPV